MKLQNQIIFEGLHDEKKKSLTPKSIVPTIRTSHCRSNRKSVSANTEKCDLTFLKYYDTKGKYVDISKRPRYNKNDDSSIQFCKITRYFFAIT